MAEFGYRASLPSPIVKQIVVRHEVGANARGMQQFGETLAAVGQQQFNVQQRINAADREAQEREAARTRARQTADALASLAQQDGTLAEQLDQTRNEADPGAADWEGRAASIIRETYDKYLLALPDDEEIRNRLRPMVESRVASALAGERQWAMGQRAAHEKQQVQTILDTAGTRLFDDPAGLPQAFGEWDSYVDLLDTDETRKEALRLAGRQKMADASLEGTMAQGGYAAAGKILEQGVLDPYLGGAEGKARWTDRVAREKDLASREAAAATKELQRGALEGLATLKVKIDNGDMPAQSAIDQGLAQARAAGVAESDILEFQYLARDAQNGAYAQRLPTAQVEAQLTELQGKANAGTATPEERALHDALDKELDRRDDDAAGDLKGSWGGSAADRAQVLTKLWAMPAGQRDRAARKLGGDAAVLARLNPGVADLALRGREVRKARPEAFMPVDDKGKPAPKMAELEAGRYLGTALMNDMGGSYRALVDTALDIFAGREAREGSGGSWDATRFRHALIFAAGGTMRRDGKIQGGIGQVRGRMIEIPDLWTTAEFDRALSREDMRDAAYAGGQPASKPDVLSNYRPVVNATGDDGSITYRFEDGNGRPLVRISDPSQLFVLRATRSPQGR